MYTISKDDILQIDKKIQKQISFLDENGLSAMGANVAPDKYLAELNNRVNSLTKLAFKKGLKPIFITITLPSKFHPTSKKYEGFTIKEANQHLYKIWNKLIQSKVLRESDYDYIQTKEPHKSGVPHLHAVFYIESEYLERFKTVFKNEMERQNIKRYEFKTEFQSDKYNRKTSAVVAYILKYIFKSFRNSKTGEMALTAYWYVKYRIRRVSMSRSLVPLRVFRRINYREEFQDIYKVTKDWFSGRLVETVKRLNIDYLSLTDEGEIVETGLWVKPNQLLSYLRKKIKLAYKPSESSKIIPVYVDDIKLFYNLSKKKFVNELVFPPLFSDWKLFNYYQSLDIDKVSLVHFGITQNECIRRGLINGKLHNLQDFNTGFDL